MSMTDLEIIKNYVRFCEDGFNMGWHERNGGNLSYRMTEEDVKLCRPYFYGKKSSWLPIGTKAENLAGEYFIVTGSGKYMRNVPLDPEGNICIVQINDEGNAYKIVWGLNKGGKITSEFASHILNHSVKKEASKGQNRVMYHAHPPYLVALTFVLPLDYKTFSDVLMRCMTECPMIFPRGIGVVPLMVPGSMELAEESAKQMKRFDGVVWAHHGLFASGEDLDSTFGLMHIIEKSAQIYTHVMSLGQGIKQTIPVEMLAKIAKSVGKELDMELFR